MEDGVCSVVQSCDKHSSTVSIGGFVRRALRISEGPELSVITGCSGSLEMMAFSNMFGDVGLTDSEITGGCCAEG
jgi:hypothetical protein